jgi:hypothetical protein
MTVAGNGEHAAAGRPAAARLDCSRLHASQKRFLADRYSTDYPDSVFLRAGRSIAYARVFGLQ